MTTKSVIKKSETRFMTKIPQQEIVEAMTELSATAYKLLMYYYSRNDGWKFTDEHIAKTIDSSVRMVPKYRKELIEKGYLLIQRGQVDVYFVGKHAVFKFQRDVTSDVKDLQDVVDEEPNPPIISGKVH